MDFSKEESLSFSKKMPNKNLSKLNDLDNFIKIKILNDLPKIKLENPQINHHICDNTTG
jgi:hypothetical protein